MKENRDMKTLQIHMYTLRQ